MAIDFQLEDVGRFASRLERQSSKVLPSTVRAAGNFVIRDARDSYGIQLRRHTRSRRHGRVAVDAKKGRVWLGMNRMSVGSIAGDARRGRRPREVVSRREGAVASSFWFVGRNRSLVRRPLPFARTGSRIHPVTTEVRTELDRVLRRARKDALALFRKDLIRQWRKGR